jgi:hypothetical protein
MAAAFKTYGKSYFSHLPVYCSGGGTGTWRLGCVTAYPDRLMFY